MYKSVYYERSRELLHIWDDELGHVCQKFKNYAFVKSEFGKYQTMHGDKVDKVYQSDYGNPNNYESDFPIETKALIEIYGGSDEPAKNIKTMILSKPIMFVLATTIFQIKIIIFRLKKHKNHHYRH